MEIATNVDLRRVLYRFYGALLLYPNRERVERLQQGATWLQQQLELQGIPDAIVDTRLLAALVDWALGLEPEPEHAQVTWTRLFGTSRIGYCQPYEGAYGAPEMASMLMIQLQREYAETGLQLASKDLPDFVAVEFEYLSHLCHLTGYAANKGERAAVEKLSRRRFRFLAQHICRWVPHLAERITENEGGIYAIALQSALHCAQFDLGELRDALELDVQAVPVN